MYLPGLEEPKTLYLPCFEYDPNALYLPGFEESPNDQHLPDSEEGIDSLYLSLFKEQSNTNVFV